MAGLYIHIPFCKQACNYCNFHFSTSLANVNEVINAICTEVTLRKTELTGTLQSIYLGGGTPSLLGEADLMKIFDTIFSCFDIAPKAEITLEANPDDVTHEKLNWIKQTPVNRFSLGVQSFFNEDLVWMNRAHQALEAERAILLIQDAGFERTTIDLIYGGPTLSHERWQKNLEKAVALGLHHISAYALTVEPKTQLHHQIAKGKVAFVRDEHVAEQFDLLVSFLESAGFEQYEISNFAKNQEYATHNTAYWLNKPYLGIGPSAHSFDGLSRSWNIANNQLYLKAIQRNQLPLETEHLTIENRINEYIMTGLRTIWGCNWQFIETQFGSGKKRLLEQKIIPFIRQQHITTTKESFKLTRQARILADGIASELFF
ncbi:MAG: radical SAM family heme chaperone HemW [Bacteroidetes bacterium]|nr:MAG: radical SAM family heme chaperone HemW [Bacteroidota bacterium]